MRHLDPDPGGKDTDGPDDSGGLDVLGDHPKTRILLALLTDPDRDYNVSDIARLAETSRSTVYRHLDDLLEVGLIEYTRTSGNAPMYQINLDSDAARAFVEFEGKVRRALGELSDVESPDADQSDWRYIAEEEE